VFPKFFGFEKAGIVFVEEGTKELYTLMPDEGSVAGFSE
jgi:hypothetical protein